jgi:hypothetical protein
VKEKDTNCEERCCYFQALSLAEQELNRRAKEITRKGKEFPGSLNTLCGSCVRTKIIEFCLDEKISELSNSEG